jgi:IS1 family transposase/transposase-like protein
MNCPSCHRKAHRHGTQENGVQRWKCNNNACDVVTFNNRYGSVMYRMRIPEKEAYEITYLFFTGYPISNIAQLKKYAEKSVRGFLKKSVSGFEKFEEYQFADSAYVPEAIEVDEIYIKLQGKKKFYAWIAYDPVNKVVIDFEIGKRDEESLDKIFGGLQKYRANIKLVLIDGYRPFKKVIKKYLGRTKFKPTTGVINKSKYMKEQKGFLTYALFGKSRNEVERMIIEFHLGNKISTALIERLNRDFRDCSSYMARRTHRLARLLEWVKLSFRGRKAFHNVSDPHLTLSFKSSKNWISIPITPCMEAGVTDKVFSIEDVLAYPTFK